MRQAGMRTRGEDRRRDNRALVCRLHLSAGEQQRNYCMVRARVYAPVPLRYGLTNPTRVRHTPTVAIHS